jgi:hypothetical protein
MLTCGLTGTTEAPGSAAANTTTIHLKPMQRQAANSPESSGTTARHKWRRTADLRIRQANGFLLKLARAEHTDHLVGFRGACDTLSVYRREPPIGWRTDS